MTEPTDWEAIEPIDEDLDTELGILRSLGWAIGAAVLLLVGIVVVLSVMYMGWQDRPEKIRLPGTTQDISTGK